MPPPEVCHQKELPPNYAHQNADITQIRRQKPNFTNLTPPKNEFHQHYATKNVPPTPAYVPCSRKMPPPKICHHQNLPPKKCATEINCHQNAPPKCATSTCLCSMPPPKYATITHVLENPFESACPTAIYPWLHSARPPSSFCSLATLVGRTTYVRVVSGSLFLGWVGGWVLCE